MSRAGQPHPVIPRSKGCTFNTFHLPLAEANARSTLTPSLNWAKRLLSSSSPTPTLSLTRSALAYWSDLALGPRL
jgi:hypothetical protein